MTADALENSADTRDLYRELILDHARSPRHFGALPSATHSADGINPLCGDKLHLYLEVAADGTIRDARFEGTGCAISLASASLMTDLVNGMSKDDAIRWFEAVTTHLTGAGDNTLAVNLGKLRALEGVRDFPSRIKCATLAWHALDAALRGKQTPATTE